MAGIFKTIIIFYMIKSKTILITGASSGIGRYIVETLAARGHFVFAGYRDPKDALEIKKINPEKIQPILLDITSEESISQAKKVINETGRELDVLFNNAGLALGGPLEAISIESIKKLYEVNFFGCVKMIQNFLPLLRKSQGRIINISSISGLLVNAFLIPYSSSKYAVEALSDGLRRELKLQKIKVVIIEPGSIKTPIWKKSTNWSEEIMQSRPDILALYQPAVDNFLKFLRLNAKRAAELSKLKRAIIRAVESQRPKARYQAYFTNWLLAMFVKLMPAKFIDWLFDHFLDK